jgi:hypothetical protein
VPTSATTPVVSTPRAFDPRCGFAVDVPRDTASTQRVEEDAGCRFSLRWIAAREAPEEVDRRSVMSEVPARFAVIA